MKGLLRARIVLAGLLCAMLILSICETRLASASVQTSNPSTTLSRDVYYKTEGVVSGPPASRPSVGSYPRLLGESRLVI